MKTFYVYPKGNGKWTVKTGLNPLHDAELIICDTEETALAAAHEMYMQELDTVCAEALAAERAEYAYEQVEAWDHLS